MATRINFNRFQFRWGDTVLISADAPQPFRPNEMGSVCGIRVVKPHPGAKSMGAPTETVLYFVEFGDGYAVEIPEKLLLGEARE